ncbi:MAG: caspase family protein [Bacteroidota bacterium]
MPQEETDKGLIPRKSEYNNGQQKMGENYLFVIAIDAYVHCPTLYNCLRDAQQLIDILTTQYQFEKANVKTLFNEQATEGNIFNGFRELAKTITPEDNLLIYFSGHGEYDPIFDEGYWIPVNAQLGAHEDFVPNSKIKTILGAINSKHTFLIADSCFSGSLFNRFKSVAVANRLENFPSRWGLTAGRNEVVSDGKPGDNSPFAESLLYHLRVNKKALGVATLCNRVIENVVASANQTPRGEPLKVKGHRGGQFFFHPKTAVRLAPKSSVKTGNLLYQIPSTMELNKDTKCTVRIAFDEATLKRELDIAEEAKIKSIRVSNVMEVDLLDPLSAGTFEIRALNEKEQLIEQSDFTQWLFYVKAKKEGTFPLLLKVAVIEVLYGKERKKEIVLEERVSVVTKIEKAVVLNFKNAGYAFAVDQFSKAAFPAPEPELARTDSGGRYQIPPPSPAVKPPVLTAPPDEDFTFSGKSSKLPRIGKILGGIAAVFVIFVIANNIYLNQAVKPKPKAIPKPTSPTTEELNWQSRELQPFTDPQTRKRGYKDRQTGRPIISGQYDMVTNFKDGVAFVKKDNRWGLIDKRGAVIINFLLSQPGTFEDGVAVVDIGGGHLVKINPQGEVILRNRTIKLTRYIREYKRRNN